MYIAGNLWDSVPGTDHQLAMALAEYCSVLWVDPPISILNPRATTARRSSKGAGTLEPVAPNMMRLRTLAPPLLSKPVIRTLVRWRMGALVRSAVRASGARTVAVILSSPVWGFPRGIAGTRILYVTDDWLDGAPLMGLGTVAVASALKRNMAAADRAAAVSPLLAAKLMREVADALPTHVLPNGCRVQDSAPNPPGASFPAVAGLVGQLNERLDQQALEAVRASGTSLLVIGPRTERDPATSRWLDSFLAAPNVSWLGPLASSELPAHLATMSVGLTPYADTAFNRASFPLKTLEYLSAGLPVVSTDLPANQWLDTELIDVCSDAASFGARVRELVARPADMEQQKRRREFAAQHSWSARAGQMLALIEADAQ